MPVGARPDDLVGDGDRSRATTPPSSAPTSRDRVLTISGRVFEDANFAGTAADWDGGASDLGLANVDVELYDAGTSAYLASATTAAGGTFTFSSLANGNYKVRARSATIGDADTPPKGTLNASVPATWPYPLAEMTWANGAALYGGQSATVDDAATGDNAGPGDTYVTVTVSGADVTGVNLGFAYNLIVNAERRLERRQRAQQGRGACASSSRTRMRSARRAGRPPTRASSGCRWRRTSRAAPTPGGGSRRRWRCPRWPTAARLSTARPSARTAAPTATRWAPRSSFTAAGSISVGSL